MSFPFGGMIAWYSIKLEKDGEISSVDISCGDRATSYSVVDACNLRTGLSLLDLSPSNRCYIDAKLE